MALSRLFSVSLLGLDALLVEVEVDAFKSDSEKSSLVMVGLPNTVVKESKDRVMAALRNSGYFTGSLSCTVNFAPGDLKKEGTFYDLPIALGLLRSLGLLKPAPFHSNYLVIGEMGLSGELRPIRGALPAALLARELGKKGVLVPAANAKEASAVPGIDVIPIASLKEAVQFFNQPETIAASPYTVSEALFKQATPAIDFADIKSQSHVKRALEIAATGGHNVILSGPPGSGKTMLAKAMLGIMPELTVEEALEISKVHSIAGLIPEGQSLISQRPFRSPHHTVSYAGLIGGGTIPRPGEVSLAHLGILFLDELPEFSRTVLEVLRQPLEDRKVNISRAQGRFTFPTDFICIAAMNPCPCGYLGHSDKNCTDTTLQIERYRGKISGPLLDRFDMHIVVPALRYHEILNNASAEKSDMIRGRVNKGREKQKQRYQKVKTNSQITAAETKRFAPLSKECQELLGKAIDQMHLSVRACDRLIRVALTIADMADSTSIQKDHLMEAINFRHIDSK